MLIIGCNIYMHTILLQKEKWWAAVTGLCNLCAYAVYAHAGMTLWWNAEMFHDGLSDEIYGSIII